MSEDMPEDISENMSKDMLEKKQKIINRNARKYVR